MIETKIGIKIQFNERYLKLVSSFMTGHKITSASNGKQQNEMQKFSLHILWNGKWPQIVKTKPPKWGIFSVYFIPIFIYGLGICRVFAVLFVYPTKPGVCVPELWFWKFYVFDWWREILHMCIWHVAVRLRRFAFINAKQNHRQVAAK